MPENYYLRNLTITDWKKFHEMDLLIFEDEPMSKISFEKGLSSLKSAAMIVIHKETKEFIGYFKIAEYGREGHIQRIGVHPNYRRQGIGSYLLEKSMEKLSEAGCSEYFLYVLADNKEAIELYKKHDFFIETESYQFKVPYKRLIENPKGKCRHIDWGEIQLASLRFGVNPIRIQQYFGSDKDHVLIYEVMGQQLGFCRFSPHFPGAMPFILKDPKYVLDMITILKGYITNPEFDHVRITFDDQVNLVNKLNELNIPLNYNLLKMARTAKDI